MPHWCDIYVFALRFQDVNSGSNSFVQHHLPNFKGQHRWSFLQGNYTSGYSELQHLLVNRDNGVQERKRVTFGG